MRHFIAFPLSFAAIFAACDSSTSPDSYIKGDQIYERHIDRSQASMKCVVYATDYSVSLDFNFSVLSDETYMRQQLEANTNNPAIYRGKAEVSGLFLNQKDKMCNMMKNLAEDLDNGTYKCMDNVARFESTLPNVNESQKPFVISQLKETLKNQCDTWYDETLKNINSLKNEIASQNGNSDSSSGETVQSCNVIANGNTVQVSVIYPSKTAITTLTKNNNDYTIMEAYTGIEETTLARVCEAYKKDSEIKNVICSGQTFSYQSNLPADETYEIEDYVAFYQQEICPALQNGNLTLEDMWFGE